MEPEITIGQRRDVRRSTFLHSPCREAERAREEAEVQGPAKGEADARPPG